MSGIGDLSRIDRIVVPECPLYVQNSLSFFLVLADFYPEILTLGSFIWNFVKKREFLSPLLSIALALDWVINWLLHRAFNEPSRFFDCDCGHSQEMPAFATQHITLFVVILLLFGSVWGGGIEVATMIMLSFLHYLVVFARDDIGINTVPQLFWGVVIGVVEGIVVGLVLRFLVVPYFMILLTGRMSRRLGVTDTYLIPYFYRIRENYKCFTVTDSLEHNKARLEHEMYKRKSHKHNMPRKRTLEDEHVFYPDNQEALPTETVKLDNLF